jgi:hypothetical protein
LPHNTQFSHYLVTLSSTWFCLSHPNYKVDYTALQARKILNNDNYVIHEKKQQKLKHTTGHLPESPHKSVEDLLLYPPGSQYMQVSHKFYPIHHEHTPLQQSSWLFSATQQNKTKKI